MDRYRRFRGGFDDEDQNRRMCIIDDVERGRESRTAECVCVRVREGSDEAFPTVGPETSP